MTVRADRLRVVFLGCGYATRRHSRILRRVRGVDLYYASRDADRAHDYRREFGGGGSFGSYDRAVQHDVDLVVVATPPSSHLELALSALRAGKNVVVEKPAFMRPDDADEVRAVATRLGLRVFVAENYAYKPVADHLRRLIAEGDLGEVRFVLINATKRQVSNGWRADAALGGANALFEGGVHWISFAASLGLEVESARGYATGGVDSSLVVLNYANGAVGSLAHSWELAAPFGGLRLSKVQGTHGAATFESNGLALISSGRRRSIRFPALHDPMGSRAMWSDFLRALNTGAESLFTLAMARRDLRLVEEARESMATARSSA
jgi:predicted dehydrogenase